MAKMTKAYQPVEGVVAAMEHWIESRSDTNKTEVRIYPYQNGRENGYTFVFSRGPDGGYYPFGSKHYHTFYVAEHRNTDDIVIIPGVSSDWHDGRSEADWRARRLVPWGHYMEAVELMLEMDGMERVPQEEEVDA